MARQRKKSILKERAHLRYSSSTIIYRFSLVVVDISEIEVVIKWGFHHSA